MAYQYYTPITIESSQVHANHASFPLFFSGTFDGTGGEPDIRVIGSGGGIQNTGAGGVNGIITIPEDLVFSPYTDGSSPYDFEIEKYVTTTGEIAAHIRIPTMNSSTDLVFYMCYGDAGVTSSQESISAVWNANYMAVYHFNMASGQLLDSTSFNHDTEYNTVTSGYRAAGVYGGYSTDLSGWNQYFRKTNDAHFNFAGNFSWMGVAKSELVHNVEGNRRYLYASFLTSTAGWNYHMYESDYWNSGYLKSGGTGIYMKGNSVVGTEPNIFSMRRSGTSVSHWRNGTKQTMSVTKSGTMSNTHYKYIGSGNSGVQGWQGLYQEMRLSNVTRADTWHQDVGLNFSNLANFITVGTEVDLDADAGGAGSMFIAMNF